MTNNSKNFSSYAEALAWLDELGLFHMELGLERVQAFLDATGLGEPKFKVVHVVGTNGKGSTSSFLESLLREAGLKTGLFTSPHFVSVRERVKVDGRPVSEELFTGFANAVYPLAKEIGLTYFEFMTALGLWAFDALDVDVAVMEAGLGGTYDAVSAMRRDLLLYTPIGMDHEKILGSTLAAIATDKAGAIREGVEVVSGPQEPEVMDILRRAAEKHGAGFHFAPEIARVPDDATLGLIGPHQRDNATLALAAFRLFAEKQGMAVDTEAELRALEKAFIPGRLQRVPGLPEIYLDGAHNVHALVGLKRALEDLSIRPEAVIFSCLADKNLDEMAPLVRKLTDARIIVPGIPGCERSGEPADVARQIDGAEPVADIAAALDRVADMQGPVLICGSLYLLAEFYRNQPDLLEQ